MRPSRPTLQKRRLGMSEQTAVCQHRIHELGYEHASTVWISRVIHVRSETNSGILLACWTYNSRLAGHRSTKRQRFAVL